MYDALLAKLDPASMMEVGGLGKARIAINLLCKASESEPAAAAGGIAAVADGVKVLMQTALLHPEPSLREGAVSVLACCCACNDESFIASALGGGPASLPAALVRLCAEQDRKAKPETEGDEAIDPDLPARRSAVACLQPVARHRRRRHDPRAARLERRAGALLRNSDATIRERAAALLRGLLVTPAEADAATPEQREARASSSPSPATLRTRWRRASPPRSATPTRASVPPASRRSLRCRRRAPTTASCARHSRMREPRRRSATPRRTTESGSAGLEHFTCETHLRDRRRDAQLGQHHPRRERRRPRPRRLGASLTVA